MIAPLFNVPSRNSRLLEATPEAAARRAAEARAAQRSSVAFWLFALSIVAVIVIRVIFAWLDGLL